MRIAAVVAMAFATVVAGCGASDDPADRPQMGSVIAFSDLPAYRGVPWADSLQAEQKRFLEGLRPSSLGGLEASDFTSETTNVADGIRRTSPSACSCPTVEVWLVGGSSAFGLGQRDDRTIASELVRLAAEDGIDLELLNLAVPGRTIVEEHDHLAARLASARVAPDVVVSYGGFNDAFNSLIAAVSGRDLSGAPRSLTQAEVDAFLDADLAALGEFEAQELADRAGDAIARADDQLRLEIERHGAIARFYFQPDALASPHQFDPVADVYPAIPRSVAAVARDHLDRIAERLEPDRIDLRASFADADASLFVDWAHTNEAGAAIMARRIYDDLRPALVDRAS